MRPTKPLLWLITLWGTLGFVTDWFEAGQILWTATTAFLVLVVAADYLVLFSEKPLRAERDIPEHLALGVAQEIPLRLHNPHRRSRSVEVFDGVPCTAESPDLPFKGTVAALGWMELNYRVTPLERGNQEFSATQVLVRSFLLLWKRKQLLGEPQSLRVYPNYEPVLRFNLLAMTNRSAQMGIRALNRPGQSREFRQLREYQEGDPLNRLDWKATSRRLTLISRQYEEQRDQNIILALDCGRRLAMLDGDLTQFDHCLNAMLLLSHVAIRQGDAVGVLGMGDANRWLPPQKGAQQMPRLLQHLYDYQPENHPVDFTEGVRTLMARQKKRALVIVLTNLRTEDTSHLLEPLRVLRQKHLVVLASLCEQQLTDLFTKPVESFAEALTMTTGSHYLEERAALFGRFEKEGILTLDCSAASLPVALTNRYLEIKKAGII
jgi:uncharacterized protein (DUF58 family)